MALRRVGAYPWTMRFGVEAHRAALALLLLAGPVGLGCAHSDTIADRHILEMRESLDKLETEQDRSRQRLELAVGAEDPKPTRAPDGRSEGAAKGTASAPRTVQLGDTDDKSESDDPNDPNARPEIRVQGPAGAASRSSRSKSSTRGRGRESDVREGLDESSKSDSDRRPSILDPEAKKSYDAALALVNGKQYDRALEALGAFLTRWPDHPYAENAMYWRGEAYYARGEYLRAAEQFEAVLARGLGQKAPDALLKIGLCHERLGAVGRANQYWDRLRREYPRSDAAKKIPASERAPNSTNDRGAGPKESR